MKAFVIAESTEAARELCSGARRVAEEVALISIGAVPEQALGDVSYVIDLPEGGLIDDAYETVISLVGKQSPEIVFVEPTRRLKSIAGRVAARNKTAVMTDIIELEGTTATNLYFGGVAHKKQKSAGALSIYTVGAGVFEAAEQAGAGSIEHVDWITPKHPLARRDVKEVPKAETDLTKSDIVIAAGRGFAAEDDLGLVRDFGERIGGDVGCTRPLTEGVDWMPRELYIGVSGLMLSPRVYVGVGVSGQMQHMVGVNRAKSIIAINKDKNAPIFKQADIGLVGDLYTVLPEITGKLTN